MKWWQFAVLVVTLIAGGLALLNSQYVTRELAYREFVQEKTYTNDRQAEERKLDKIQADLNSLNGSMARIEGRLGTN
jgi:hypothetical protein